MKKNILIGCLIFITSCQTVTPTLESSLFPTETLQPASPTPRPASQTPERTSTPESTPTPLPQYFTSSFDSSLAGWVILQGGNDAVPNISAENSTLRLEMDSPYTWLYVLYGPFDYADVHLETVFINSALSPASAGLICRYSEEDGWLEYNVSTDGTYNVLYGQWLSVGVVDYTPVIDGTSKEIKQSGDVQKIGMTCSGTTIQLLINDTIVRNVDVSRYELAAGKAGLIASSYDVTPVIVVFDSVTVSTP